MGHGWKKTYTPILVRVPENRDPELDHELWLSWGQARKLVRRLTRELTVYEKYKKAHGVAEARRLMGKRAKRRGLL